MGEKLTADWAHRQLVYSKITFSPFAWRITNCLCQSAPPRDLIFSSTMLTLSSHEEYFHGFQLPRVPHTQTS